MGVFKAYDVRGIYPTEINSDVVARTAKAFATFLGAEKVVIGKDMRSSSDELHDTAVKALCEIGVEVVSIGLCPTPLLNFAVAHYDFDGGIMISASHNPGQYNAMKLIRKPALQIGKESGLQEIKRLAEKNLFIPKPMKAQFSEFNPLSDYLEHIDKLVGQLCDRKIVIDYGNGVGALTAKPFFDQTGLHVEHMFSEPDAKFPNHPANPHDVRNFDDLIAKVREKKADVGIFFDGDADRAELVDETGAIIFPDLITALVAEEEVKEGDKVYYDLRFSKIVKEVIEAKKGIALIEKVGNPIYKEKLHDEGGLLGVEFSGHVMFKENYGIDDGLFAALKVVKIICKRDLSLSKLIEPFRRYFQTPELNFKVNDSYGILKMLEEQYGDGKINKLDGLLVEYPNWWFTARSSNTEPIVRLRVEANSEMILNEKKEELVNLINEFV